MTAILLQGFLNEIAQPMINSVELLRARASGAVPRRAQAAGWRGGVPYPHAPLHTPCSGSWEQAGGVCDLDLEGRLLQSLWAHESTVQQSFAAFDTQKWEFFFCLCNSWLQDGDETWANWPLPVTSAGEVADVGLYARDVAKSQTLDCTPEMSWITTSLAYSPTSATSPADVTESWSSGTSSLSLQVCAVLSHGLCLVRSTQASWGRWKTGRRFQKTLTLIFNNDHERVGSIAYYMAPWRNVSLLEKCFFTERFTRQSLEQLARCGVRLGVQHTMLLCLGMRCCFSFIFQKDPWLLRNDPSDADFSWFFENWQLKGQIGPLKGVVCGAQANGGAASHSAPGQWRAAVCLPAARGASPSHPEPLGFSGRLLLCALHQPSRRVAQEL